MIVARELNYRIFSKVPFVLITKHAAERGDERCGIDPREIRNAVIRGWGCALCLIEFGKNVKWIPVSGPKGEGTIVIIQEMGGWTVVTVRDSNVFTQSERRNKKLTLSLGDLLKAALEK